jgi:hypothetical protein
VTPLLHVSTLSTLIMAAQLLIIMFLLRAFAGRYSERPIGKAVASLVA